MDVADRAQMEAASLARFHEVKPKVAVFPSATHCNECGEPIPKARQLAVKGVQFCIECQTFMEKWQG